jgi:hypothetical protein
MDMDWQAVLEHMRAHRVLAGAAPDFIELWSRFMQDGERVVQHQVLYPNTHDDESYVLVACEVHCMDPQQTLRYANTLAIGALIFVEGRAILRQAIALRDLTPAHLDRVLDATAREAARIAQLLRLDVTAPMPAFARVG